MPEHLRALVVITAIAFTGFYLASRPLTHSTMSEADFTRFRNYWFIVTGLAFVSPDFWIFCAGIAVVLFFAGAKTPRPLALYCALLFAFPHSLSREISGIAGINSLVELDYIGVLAVELFYLGEGHETPLIVNEIAPRVHNSGHWTMDACAADQFENHIRAICGWPLGATRRYVDIEMVNLIGPEVHDWLTVAGEAGSFVHLYGKAEARDGRKMGHVNRVLD